MSVGVCVVYDGKGRGGIKEKDKEKELDRQTLSTLVNTLLIVDLTNEKFAILCQCDLVMFLRKYD